MSKTTIDLSPSDLRTMLEGAIRAMQAAEQDLAFLGGCIHTDRPDLPLTEEASWTTDVSAELDQLERSAAALTSLLTRIGGE